MEFFARLSFYSLRSAIPNSKYMKLPREVTLSERGSRSQGIDRLPNGRPYHRLFTAQYEAA
jgi:hypothetical protein